MSYDLQKLAGKKAVCVEDDDFEPDPTFNLSVADLKQMCGDTISFRNSDDSDNEDIILVKNALGEIVSMTNKEFIEFMSKCPNIKM